MTVYSAVLLVHVGAAAAWFGGSWFLNHRFGPAMQGAGRDAIPVAVALLRSGGISRYFVPAAITTIVSGAYLYWKAAWWTLEGLDAWLLNGSSLVGLAALVVGAAVSAPAEKEMKEIVGKEGDDLSSDDEKRLMALMSKTRRTSGIILNLLLVAMAGMLGKAAI